MVMKIQPSICLGDCGKPQKTPSQVGRHWDLNPGPPECESRALPRSHLARSFHLSGIVLFFFSGGFLTCKTNVKKLYAAPPMVPRTSFDHHNHPYHVRLVTMNEWVNGIVFNVCVVSEVAPALSWSFIWGGPPCFCVVKKVCMWSKVNPLSVMFVLSRRWHRHWADHLSGEARMSLCGQQSMYVIQS